MVPFAGQKRRMRPTVSKLAIKSDSVIHEIIEGEAVVMNLETGFYFSFNAAATLIWAQIVDSNLDETELFQLAGAENLPFLDFLLAQELIVREPLDIRHVGDGAELQPIGQLAQWQSFSDLKELLLLDPVHDIALNDQGWPEFPRA